MPLVGVALLAQAISAELVLVAAAVRLEQALFVAPEAERRRQSVNVRRAHPAAGKSRARRTDVVVHLPARAEAVVLVGVPDRGDHLAANQVAEVGQAVERRQRARAARELAPGA